MSDTQATARLIIERNIYAATLESAYLAERVGFEPTIRFLVYTLSKRAPWTWQHAQLSLS